MAQAHEPVPRGDTGIVASVVAQGWRARHGMLGEDAALGILSVQSRKSWGKRRTLAIFSHFWQIIFEVSFAGNTFDCDILRQNSEGARTSHKCPIPGSTGWGFGQPGLGKCFPAHEERLE